MPVGRGGTRRGRRRAETQQREQLNPVEAGGQAIATRTRRRRAAALAEPADDLNRERAGAGNEGDMNNNRVLGEGLRLGRGGAAKVDDGADKPLDDYDSGGKANGVEDDGNASPVPEKVCALNFEDVILSLHV